LSYPCNDFNLKQVFLEKVYKVDVRFLTENYKMLKKCIKPSEKTYLPVILTDIIPAALLILCILRKFI